MNSALGTVAASYGYTNTQWGDMLTSYTTLSIQSISYDAMGNPTSYLGKALSWQGKQLTGVTSGTGSGATTIAYAYDENGLRTQKTVNGTTTNYYYNGSVLIGMVTGSGATAIHQLFSYGASGSVVSVDYSSDGGSTFATYYYLRNAQNDVISLIDSTGATVVQYVYDSWGKLIATTGSLATSLGQDQPFRYRGYVYDAETQWYYLQSRYYNPTLCRFISADVLLSTGQGVLGHNSFAYCLNNPINMSDVTGAYPADCIDNVRECAYWGMVFNSLDEAAIYATQMCITQTAETGVECGTYIYATETENGTVFWFRDITEGEPQKVAPADYSHSLQSFVSFDTVALVHSHPIRVKGWNIFSEGDVACCEDNGFGYESIYLGLPNGSVYRLNKSQSHAYLQGELSMIDLLIYGNSIEAMTNGLPYVVACLY